MFSHFHVCPMNNICFWFWIINYSWSCFNFVSNDILHRHILHDGKLWLPLSHLSSLSTCHACCVSPKYVMLNVGIFYFKLIQRVWKPAPLMGTELTKFSRKYFFSTGEYWKLSQLPNTGPCTGWQFLYMQVVFSHIFLFSAIRKLSTRFVWWQHIGGVVSHTTTCALVSREVQRMDVIRYGRFELVMPHLVIYTSFIPGSISHEPIFFVCSEIKSYTLMDWVSWIQTTLTQNHMQSYQMKLPITIIAVKISFAWVRFHLSRMWLLILRGWQMINLRCLSWSAGALCLFWLLLCGRCSVMISIIISCICINQHTILLSQGIKTLISLALMRVMLMCLNWSIATSSTLFLFAIYPRSIRNWSVGRIQFMDMKIGILHMMSLVRKHLETTHIVIGMEQMIIGTLFLVS